MPIEHRGAGVSGVRRGNAVKVEWTIVAGTVLALLIAGIAGIAITRNIAGPLQELTSAAQRIAVGDLGANVVVDGRDDEVGLLAQTFRLSCKRGGRSCSARSQ